MNNLASELLSRWEWISGVLVAVVLGLLAIYKFYSSQKKLGVVGIPEEKNGPIVILGPSLSGKTSLFLALMNDSGKNAKGYDDQDLDVRHRASLRTVMSATVNERLMVFDSSSGNVLKNN